MRWDEIEVGDVATEEDQQTPLDPWVALIRRPNHTTWLSLSSGLQTTTEAQRTEIVGVNVLRRGERIA